MDNRIGRRIKKLENVDVDSFQATDGFQISKELFNRLDLAQQESLPQNVRVHAPISDEYRSATKVFFNDEISYKEYDKRIDEISDYEGITDEEFRECIEKYGGLRYNWTPARLKILKAGKVPTE